MAELFVTEIEERKKGQKIEHMENKKPKETVDESEEEEEDDDRGELEDLTNGNPVEGSDNESDTSSDSKNRKKREEEDPVVENDDYDLIEGYTERTVQKEISEKVTTIDGNESDDVEDFSISESKENSTSELFDGGSGDEDERSHRPEPEMFYQDDSDADYSDADDFIFDDEGKPITQKYRKKKQLFSDAVLCINQDVLEVDYDELEKSIKEDYEEEKVDEYVDDDCEGEIPRRLEEQPEKETNKKTIHEIYEPSELRPAHLTDLDNEIQTIDISERLQLR